MKKLYIFGDNTTIGTNAAVGQDISENATVASTDAKFVKYRKTKERSKKNI